MARFRILAVTTAFALAACSKDAPQDASPGASPAAEVSTTTASTAEPTEIEISNYPLDMDKMRKWANTQKYLAEAVGKDPSVKDAMSSGQESFNEEIAKLEAHPAAREALRKAGWSARDYVFTTAAYLQAGMTEGMLASNPGAKIPDGQSTKNIEFIRANKSAIEQVAKDAGVS